MVEVRLEAVHPSHKLSGAEAVAASALAAFAAPILGAYLIDLVGLRFSPVEVLSLTVLATFTTAIGLGRGAVWLAGELAAFVLVVMFILLWLLWLGRPALLPPGHGPDLTHHLLLIDHIERRWSLVHDRAEAAYLGEMLQYTPGVHLLAALGGAWARSDGLHAVYSIVAASVALKAGFVYLIALRTVSRDVPRIPIAVAGVVLLFLPRQFFLGSFTYDSFFAQVVSELFAVAAWWALVLWDERPSTTALVLFSIGGIATFLTWPILVGPLMIALVTVVAKREQILAPLRSKHLLIGIVPIATIAGTYVFGRVSWLGMAGTGGSVIRPTPDKFGWWFLVLSLVGLGLAVWRRPGRATAMLAGACLVQAFALYEFANARGADAPYLALKMFYFGVYLQAVAAALALAEMWRASRRGLGSRLGRLAFEGTVGSIVAWALLIVLANRVGRPVIRAPRPVPLLSNSVYRAGVWARAHVPPACVEYLVGDPDTAYWLHLAVLGNPRISPRTARDDTYEPRAAILRWLTPGGLPYAIADLTTLPRDVREELDVMAEFGGAAVVRRRGLSSCPTG